MTKKARPQVSRRTREISLFPVAMACTAFIGPGAAFASPQQSPTAPAATTTAAAKQPDRATAYYHFGLAHMYEEMATNYGRPEYATRAIEEYKLALDADPGSKYLNSGLAELYLRTGRVRDAVLAALG